MKMLLASILLKVTTIVAADYSACFHEDAGYGITVAGASAAQSYFEKIRLNAGVKPYLQLVCDTQKLTHAAEIENAMPKVALDGTNKDWPAHAPAIDDARGNVQKHETRAVIAGNSDVDLTRVRYLYNGGDLYLNYEFAAKPDAANANYWLHVYDDNGRQVYDFIFGSGNFVNVYKDGALKESRALTGDEASFAASASVEFRLAAKAFALPTRFQAIAASFSQSRKIANWSRKFEIISAGAAAQGHAALVLQSLAGKKNLAGLGLLPLAISLSESFALANSTPDLKARILADAAQMLELGVSYGVESQNENFEALIAWSNRALMWGGLGGLYPDTVGKINAEAYDFMFLNPVILNEVRAQLLELPAVKSGNVSSMANAVDEWALKLNRYRWKPEEVCRWAKEYPSRQDFAQLCTDSTRDAADGGKIGQVNGNDIYIWAIMGPNYQWASAKAKGFYFGPCGDVAVMTMVGLKALGIADLGLYRKYGLTDDLVHTFVAYYDPGAGKWMSPKNQVPPKEQKKTIPKPYLQWSLPPVAAAMPVWQKKTFADGAVFWVNERSPVATVPIAELRASLQKGIAHSTVRKLLLASFQSQKPVNLQTSGAKRAFSLSND